jgi:hypothetical protein
MLFAEESTFWSGFWMSLPGIITALGIGIPAIMREWYTNRKFNDKLDANTVITAATANKVNVVEKKVDDVHELTNHLKDELVAEVRSSEFAKGVKQETDKQIPKGSDQ